MESKKDTGNQFLLRILHGVIFALCIGQLDQDLQITWWKLIVFASVGIFGLYGTGLLIAWGVRHDDGKGAGCTIIPGIFVLFLLCLAGFLATVGMVSSVPNSVQPSVLLFVTVVGIASLIMFMRAIKRHVN